MSISTGDSRSTPKKSTSPTAAGGAKPDAVPDEPVGGVLPVKKTTRTGSNGGARTGSAGTGTAKSSGNGSASKATPAKATPGSGAKTPAAGTKSTPSAKAAPAKSSSPSSASKPKTQSGLVGGKGGKGGSALTGGKGGGRRPTAPVKVAQSRNWGPILLYTATGLAALAIIAIGAWPVIADRFKPSWTEQAAAIPSIMNYLDPGSPNYDATVTSGSHQPGILTYPMTPPVGGAHNDRWQNCMGDVYPAEIAEEHAVHSLEHGAVWITYRPDLPQDQIDKLARKVDGREFMLMSPYPNLDVPISLQAWGYQLKVDNADDGRIDDFITALRKNATQEEQAGCSSGITDPSPIPLEF